MSKGDICYKLNVSLSGLIKVLSKLKVCDKKAFYEFIWKNKYVNRQYQRMDDVRNPELAKARNKAIKINLCRQSLQSLIILMARLKVHKNMSIKTHGRECVERYVKKMCRDK